MDDWLAEGLDGRSAKTATLNRHILKPVTAIIGGIELRMLTAQDVRRALVRLAAGRSTRTVTIGYDGSIWAHHDGSMWPHLAAS